MNKNFYKSRQKYLNLQLIGSLFSLLLILILASSFASAQINTTGLLSAYTFDTANNPTPNVLKDDFGLYNLTGTITQNVAGKNNEAFYFNKQFLNGTSALFNRDLNSFNGTISVWIKTNNLTTNYMNFYSWADYGAFSGFGNNWGVANLLNIPTAGADYTVSSSLINTGVWINYILIYDNGLVKLYENGINIKNQTAKGTNINLKFFMLGGQAGQIPSRNYNGTMDELYIYNRTITAQEITDLQTNFYQTSGPPTSNPTISFTTPPTPTNASAFYLKNESMIINATITSGNFNIDLLIYNSTGTAIKGYCTGCSVIEPTIYTVLSASSTNSIQATINTTNLSLPTGTYYFNTTFTNGTYTNKTETRTFYIYNITQNGINQPSNNQAVSGQTLFISWNATTTNPTVNNTFEYNVSLYNQSGSFIKTLNITNNLNFTWSDIYSLNLSLGNHILNLSSKDFNNNLVYQTKNINITTNANLTIQLQNAYNGSAINNNGTLNVTLNNQINSYNIINGKVSFDIAKNTTYGLFFDVNGFAYKQTNYTTNFSTYQNQNFTLYTNNSVLVNIFDENTNQRIYLNISVTFTGLTETIYYTNTSELYVDNLADGNYTVKFLGGNYTLKSYTITVGARSTQNLNAYLSESSPVVFTFLDFDSSAVLPGTTFVQQRLINSTWTVVDTKTSDITGRAQVYYVTGVKYQFVASLSNYQTQSFILDPVLFSTYNVRLQKTTSLSPSNTPSGLGVNINYGSNLFYTNQTTSFVWVISSPVGSLVNYTLNVSYPGGEQTFFGNQAIGEQFSHTVNISGASLTDKVYIKYCYDTTTGSNQCFNYQYGIIGSYSSYSIMGNRNQTYGLGTFERILIVTIFVLIVAGLTFFLIGMLPGMLVGLFLYGYFYYVGFIPLWSILPTLLVGVVLIFGRSD